MSTNVKINVVEDVTLISLLESPADINVISSVFNEIANAGIDVDMISQSPHGKNSTLSFTVSGEDFGRILEISSKMREFNPNLKFSVSSGNCKISVFSEEMRGCPGYSAKIFAALAQHETDIRMVTTSEVDISLLVTESDKEAAIAAINEIDF